MNFSRDYERNLESAVPDADRHWADADVHFNRRMNTCLVEIKWDEMRDDELGRVAVVVDVYNNRQIISTHDMPEEGDQRASAGRAGAMDPKAYLVEKKVLFRE